MRLEAKHHILVKLANEIQNFKNITFSLANRHQLDLAYIFDSNIHDEKKLYFDKFSPCRIIPVEELNLNENTKNFIKVKEIACYSWVKVDTIKHSLKKLIYLGKANSLYLFGKISYLFSIDDRAIYVHLYQSSEISQIYQAYSILETNQYKLVSIKDLKDYQSFRIKHSITKNDPNKF
jgi:hypothetical protein